MSTRFALLARPLVALLVAATAGACGPAAEPSAPQRAERRPETKAPPSGAPQVAAPARREGARNELVLVTDRAALQALEERGHTLGERLDGRRGSNAELAGGPRFGAIVKAIEGEIASVRQNDPLSGVGVGDKPHRLFDVRYLRAQDARFELIGVVNRIDRVAFAPDKGCGEVRLVYRLAYAKPSVGGDGSAPYGMASRLPATVALEFLSLDPRGKGACNDAMERWRAPAGLSGAALGEWLAGDHRPLAAARLAGYELGAVTLNVQTVRWPSTIRPDMAGHAEYLLRSFRLDAAGALVPQPLENTPDVARIRQQPALRKDLLAWIADERNLAAIDAGTAVLPERFLATRAISVSPRGLARRANRPFRQLIDPKELSGLHLDGRREIRSPAALLRRLDALSCQGCHQSRSVAGFHLLGEDEQGSRSANAIAVPFSPHVAGDIPRRRALLLSLLLGEEPEVLAPFPERASTFGGRGAHCGLGDPGFAHWTCWPGLSCVEDDTSSDAIEVGVCVPEGQGQAGDPCEVARVAPDENGRRDRVAQVTKRPCAASAVCDKNGVGFPGGMCATSCEAVFSHGICGRIPILTGFNDCLARKVPFEQCIAENVRPAGLAACDAVTPCRDDYVCARTASGAGACMPPYFLFQLRVDGHPPGGP